MLSRIPSLLWGGTKTPQHRPRGLVKRQTSPCQCLSTFPCASPTAAPDFAAARCPLSPAPPPLVRLSVKHGLFGYFHKSQIPHSSFFFFFFFPNCPFFFLSLPKGHISGTSAISEAMLFPPFPPRLALSPRFSSAPALPACSKNPGAMPAGPPAGCCSISSAVPAPAERQRRAEPSRAEPGRARHSGLEQTPAQQQDAKCHFLAENTLLSHAC